ncbi:MAG: hypothetical protein M9952_06385 [Microthrixaceae bacterium]|nr:hypothetical protein [Microthrixaceae bacterium]MCO5312550.1 hypothetical protein [Microthrixaceae bacterium]
MTRSRHRTPTAPKAPTPAEVELVARISVGLGVGSLVSVLVPTVPIILGIATLLAAFTARRHRSTEGPGPERHAIVMGIIGICVGALMMAFYLYGASKLRG